MDARDFHKNIRSDFLEAFEGIENEDGTPNEDYEPEQYWQDKLYEICDSAVPIYTRELVELWLDLNCPEVDDPGLIEGVSDVTKIIGVAIYEAANEYIYTLVEEYKLDK